MSSPRFSSEAVFDLVVHYRWFGTNLGAKADKDDSKRAVDSAVVGRYIQATSTATAPASAGSALLDDEDRPVKKIKRAGAGFGNFEGW